MENLVQRYLPVVFGLSWRYLRNKADAEDAVQEVFVKIWRNLRKFNQQKSFKTWICEIAKNTCLDMIKKKKAIPFSAFESNEGGNYLTETLATAGLSPVELAERSMLKRVFKPAIKNLPLGYQKVLNMYYWKGLNFREISETLNQPLNTIKSRHRRAVISLERLLDL